ncbi:hypothetical protein [Streptomyces collinus]|uniref:hypothetical protein n=1 Tax=Streptomyces collinus TaxID=42684 RepID=UPI00363E46B4
MRCSDVRQDDGAWAGPALDVRDRRRPGLCVFSAERRLLLSQGARPVLLADVDVHHEGVDFWRTDGYRSFVPPPGSPEP